MTPQDTIRATTEAGESWFHIFTQSQGPMFILLVVLTGLCVYALWRLRDKDRQTETVQGKLGVNFQTLYDQQQKLISRVEMQEEQCQRDLDRTREELDGMRIMVVRLREKLFARHILSAEDQGELDACQHPIPRR